MNQFSDINIIECNRLHSEEAQGEPLRTENNSLWTNNLSDIVHLESGDKISVYGAFISERGAGQQTAIEVKGVELGKTQTFDYTKQSEGDPIWNDGEAGSTSGYKYMTYNYETPTFNIRDDTARFTISYYAPANAHNSMHLPRRWSYAYSAPRENWTAIDSRGYQGVSLWYPDKGGIYLPNQFYATLLNTEGERILKPKNDNSRYTILVRNKTYFESTEAEGNLNPQDLRDPEYDPGQTIEINSTLSTYRTFKELKEIVVPAGFNSAEFLATEMTRQLQKITEDNIYIRSSQTHNNEYPISAIKTLSSETYKPFMAGNIIDNSKDNFLDYFNLETATGQGTRAGWTNGSGSDWLRQYQFVGCKYPELFETGRLINRNEFDLYTGSLGARIQHTTFKASNKPLILNIKYDIDGDRDMTTLFKSFFDAQKLYPEIYKNFDAFISDYEPGSNLDNSRYMHINRYAFDKMSMSATPSLDNAQLGWSGYQNPRSWTPSATDQLSSLLMLLYFDPKQENIFYEYPDEKLDQYTFGCLGRTTSEDAAGEGWIKIYPNKNAHNGFGTNVYNEIFRHEADICEAGRKVGFDMHFSAPGMNYLLPLSGWTIHANDKFSHGSEMGNFIIQDDQNSGTIEVPRTGTDITTDKNQLYLGADNPTISWDGTHFALSNLHTNMNRGNRWDSEMPTFGTTQDPEAGDVVYKINPPEHFCDYSPDRTPYRFDGLKTFDYLGNAMDLPRLNDNLDPWRIYDYLSGIFIEDFGVPENLWEDSLWGILGFSYAQFHNTLNNRNIRVQFGTANALSLPTTNAEIIEGDTKIFMTNWTGVPMYNNMIQSVYNIIGHAKTTPYAPNSYNSVYPVITHKTQSISLIADNLPTRMIRGYYTIRSNLLEDAPFIGGKRNNTQMPIIGIVDKINGDGDFYFGQESSLVFTLTKPLRLASIGISIHDPDGSYANTSKQSTILFKVERQLSATFNQVEQLLQENLKGKNPKV